MILGSSPLARGLLPGLVGDGHGIRIIPARAGFTNREPRSILLRGDHPRSRGVYAFMAPFRSPTIGSSPLARGLPVTESLAFTDPRIIPARAGFTENVPLTFSVRGDHPRSRGVYQYYRRA